MQNELSKTLQHLIDANKLTARKLARESGISVSTISDILNGRQPSLKNLLKLSEFFDVSLDYLVNGKKSSSTHHFIESDFEELFEGIVKIKISKLKKGKN